MARNVNASYEPSDNKRTPLISGWTYKAGTVNTAYVTSSSSIYSAYNPHIKLATVSCNLEMTTLPSTSGFAIATGLPKATWWQYITFANGATGTMRGYINGSGQLIIDVAPTMVGWYAGEATYAYSSI